MSLYLTHTIKYYEVISISTYQVNRYGLYRKNINMKEITEIINRCYSDDERKLGLNEKLANISESLMDFLLDKLLEDGVIVYFTKKDETTPLNKNEVEKISVLDRSAHSITIDFQDMNSSFYMDNRVDLWVINEKTEEVLVIKRDLLLGCVTKVLILYNLSSYSEKDIGRAIYNTGLIES